MTCTFCAHTFSPGEARTTCEACLWFGGCRGVRCPQCGYEMPEDLGFLSWLTRRSKTVLRANLECRLAEMQPGESGTVSGLHPANDRELHKLLALGVIPGSTITLRRRSPAYVFEIGFSQLAVDRQLANTVMVRLGEGSSAE